MITNPEREALYVGDGLRSALLRLRCYHTQRVGNEMLIFEPAYRGLYYANEPPVVVVAIDREQFPPDRTVAFFDDDESRTIFTGYLGQGVEAIEADGVIYFRIEVSQVAERIAV